MRSEQGACGTGVLGHFAHCYRGSFKASLGGKSQARDEGGTSEESRKRRLCFLASRRAW